VISVAGGWAGGSINSPTIFDVVQEMLTVNLQSAIVASNIASRCLKPVCIFQAALITKGGLLVLTGANAALGPTPGMIGYV
jgi:dihydropteridine reductase